jgi:NAD(P)-dependent dehydrogenase (short-subunit alcohol dehydrogenase family)
MAGMLEGKVAVVTGAGRGIGRASALALAEQGAKVLVNDLGAELDGKGRDESAAQAVVDEIDQKVGKGQAIADAQSVTEWESAEKIVAKAVDKFGRVDILVNSAGILRDTIFHRMTPEDFDAVIRVHLYGTFNMSRLMFAHFKQQESGALIHMSSTSGLIGSIAQANYAAAKMGIIGLSRGIAMDGQRFHIRSNCIAPHAFSRMIEAVPGQTEEQMKARADKTRPEQVAQLVAFLASDAAKDISGQIIGARGNELYLYNQPRPVRTLHRDGGWTPETLKDVLLPSWRSSLTPLERTRDIFSWEAV